MEPTVITIITERLPEAVKAHGGYKGVRETVLTRAKEMRDV